MESITTILARELGKPAQLVENVVQLLDEGNTIPFIARYRKEQHGSMDDTALRTLYDRLSYLRNLFARKEEVKKLIDQQDKLTPELAAGIDAAVTLAELDDLYRPFRPKRRTRATIAKERGLEPLALVIYAQEKGLAPLHTLAAEYVNPELEVNTPEDALAGASDIIAEMISDAAEIRKKLRAFMMRAAEVRSSAIVEEDTVYRLYYDFTQPIPKLHHHQVLALNRGEKEEKLKVWVEVEEGKILEILKKATVIREDEAGEFVYAAASDAWGRLIFPSMQREIRNELTDAANEGAIHNFALNLRPLLMQPPVKGHVTMGLDPGYRNGCKVAVVDETGKVLDTTVVYPTFSERHKRECIDKLSQMAKRHRVEHIAIGNGTASRETEQMTIEMIREFPGELSYIIVNEAGASVYSASKLAAEEFPQFDVNLRSAVSIARRLQDPLAELVKIDPKSIGIGQYQHDMPGKRLDEALGAVVEACVNGVGVDLNTASPPLLTRVSGLTAATAKNIVVYREENGGFNSRKEILKVPKLGPKIFQQCAGFLRVPESKVGLDNTGVHPESYKAAETLLTLCGYDPKNAGAESFVDLNAKIGALGEEMVAERCGIGLPTLRDIAAELQKPGRDPRDELPPPLFRRDVLEISDLKTGMILPGTVRNVIDFGAFVDIGVHQDGLVHISEVAGRFVRHPSEVLAVGDVVEVMVLGVDEAKKRISLSIRKATEAKKQAETQS